MIKKADIILGIFLILLCLSSLFFLRLSGTGGDLVVISADGKEYGTYDLSKDQRITVRARGDDAYNIVEIRDGAVFMAEANCSNQVCVHQGAIRRSNQTIVCLPNRVVVSIRGSQTDSMDDVSY
ncbi:NusG domain II-containing protein [Bacilliculturomica massiliensis]|uniref:NusG domain II-containing protein n=1 Tax=Bacilliculturomica massiliensis TaxID=1917867 RepID=UPI0013EEEB2B|nr:NusG domain II-containing protein [Bacilliculturomica massiliensis]